jgi:hypothetical protein
MPPDPPAAATPPPPHVHVHRPDLFRATCRPTRAEMFGYEPSTADRPAVGSPAWRDLVSRTLAGCVGRPATATLAALDALRGGGPSDGR